MSWIRFIAVGMVALITCTSLTAAEKSGNGKSEIKNKTSNRKKAKAFDDPSQLKKAIKYILRECYFENKEKFEELRQLEKTDRKKFLQTVIPLIKAEAKKRKEAVAELKKLLAEYKKNPSDSNKKKITAMLAKAQDKVIHWQKLTIEKMEEKLKQQKTRLNELVSKRDEKINNQFRKLTTERSKQW